MKLVRALTLLLSAFALALSGCTSPTSNDAAPNKPSTTQEAPARANTPPERFAPSGKAHTFTDHAGNTVTIPGKVERVVFDYLPIQSTYAAYFEGAAPFVVGMSQARVAQLKDTILANIAPSMLKVDTSFSKANDINIESLQALKPDVVFYNAADQERGKLLANANIPAVGFSTLGDPLETYAEWMTLLDKVFDTPDYSTPIINRGKELISEGISRLEKVPESERLNVLFLSTFAQPGSLGVAGNLPNGKKWFTESWEESLHVTNLATQVAGMGQANVEQILAWDPDAILITGRGMALYGPDEIYNNELEGVDLTSMRAVKNKRVYQTGLGMWNWFTPNPDAPLALNVLGSQLYPDQFKDADFVAMTKDYYRDVYKYELTDSQAEKLLAISQ